MFIGKLTIALAAVFAVFATIVYFYVGRGHRRLMLWGRRGYYIFTFFACAAAALLMYAFLTNDFRIDYVYSYSSIGDGLAYNIAGFWGGQQGTFLLWLAMGSVIGLWLVRHAQDDDHAGMSIFYFMLIQIFLLIVLLVKSPFALVPGLPAGMVPPDGRGLNPLLQDPWMVIHPPIVFAGFASAAVPFALALGALTLNRYKEWAPRAQPWVLFTVITLGTGLIMGGYWAYKVLGWGGYWAWDPVENSIIIPWFIGLALMHGLLIERREGSLRKSNLALSILAFVLIMFGTFLTRSGVLADFSVHSFVDLGLNAYLVFFMILFIGLGIFWISYRYKSIRVPEVNKKLTSREFMVFMAMLIFAVTAALVLLGTSSPLFTRIWGDPAAVTIDYYNRITFPLAIALALLLGIYPYFMWRGEGTHVGQKISVAALFALAGTCIAFVLGVRQPSYMVFTFASLFAIFGNVLYLVFFYRRRWYLAGSYISHLGFGVLLLGVLTSSAFSTSQKIELREGDTASALGFDLKYLGKSADQTGQGGTLDVAVRNGDDYFMAYPRFFWSEFNQGYMRKPHVMKTALYDIYIAPEEHYAPGENPAERLTNTLELLKGQTGSYDGTEYTFEKFEIGSHTDGSSDMRVTAQVTARTYGGDPERLAPYLEMTGDDRVAGEAVLENGTVVTLAGIQADAGAILLKFERPGQQVQQASFLVLEVSRKPLVSLVWIGSILTVFGTLLALYFRGRAELAHEASGTHRAASPARREEPAIRS